MVNTRRLYVFSIAAAIVAAFSSFFSNEVKAAFFLFAIVMDMVVNKDALNSRPLKLLLVFYFISFLYVFGLGRGHFCEIRNILLPYPMMLMCFCIAPGLMKLKVSEAKLIWLIFFMCFAENIIATVFIGQVDPWAVRYIFKGFEDEANTMMARSYSRIGMLSYSTAHILALLCPLLVVVAFQVEKNWKKIIVLFIDALAVYVMYLTTITTALMLGLLFMVAIAVFFLSKGNARRFILLYSVFALLLLETGGLTNLLFRSSQGENYEIAAKLNDVAESIETGRVQGQVASRENEYNLTWDAISRNPILGGAKGPEDTGQHALVFDYWAYYGFFSLFLFIAWWKEVKRMKSKLTRKMWNAYLICIFPIILMCFLKGPIFLPNYIFATIVILRVGFLAIASEQSRISTMQRFRRL